MDDVNVQVTRPLYSSRGCVGNFAESEVGLGYALYTAAKLPTSVTQLHALPHERGTWT